MSEPVLCRADELMRFTTDVLTQIGMRVVDARGMAEIIVAADLAGHESCGLRQLVGYVDVVRAGKVDPVGEPVIDCDQGSVLRVDGSMAFGHVVFRKVTDLVVERAQEHGVCAIAVRRTHHLGRVADFCDLAARAGVATMFFCNLSGGFQVVVPQGGRQERLSTNPIAFGVPRSDSDGPHLVVDMATSSVAFGRLADSRDRGEATVGEWVTPQGLLRPFGGAKGFGLALIAEALAGALGGAGTVGPAPATDAQGALVVGINIAALRPLGEMTADLDAALTYIRDVPLADPTVPVRIPGESSALKTAQRRADGVPLQRHTWRQLLQLAADLGVPPPEQTRTSPAGVES